MTAGASLDEFHGSRDTRARSLRELLCPELLTAIIRESIET